MLRRQKRDASIVLCAAHRVSSHVKPRHAGPYGEPPMLLNELKWSPLWPHTTRRSCSTGQHKRGHLKRAHEAPDVLYCVYEAHGAQKTVLRGSQAIEAVLPAVDACARSRHAGIYARRIQRHFSRSQDYKPLCKCTRGLTRLSGRKSGLPMPQGHSSLVAVTVPILRMSVMSLAP